ncbi:hypothetical protein MBLNU459_g6605t1 [Dothideomycetes sp. NU459]
MSGSMPRLPSPPASLSLPDRRTSSDRKRNGALADTDSVMADQSSHNVVNNDRSMGEHSPIDVHANNDQISSAAAGNNSVPALSQRLTAAQGTAPPVLKPGYSAGQPESNNILTAPDGNVSNAEDADSRSQASRNGTPAPALNGERDGIISGDEGATTDNVGSDTDSRADSVDQGKVPSSLKKPASFKPVSVTKAFLAKTATTAVPVATKVGDKNPATASLQPMAKPRLVAKSGSGLRDIPRIRPGDGTSAPDGRTVWNKNQPVPPAPPKQFTDEELKQQYGIHLASRLQEDESNGKSKWADVDDDEEDWAPETVEWMDGTKSTVNKAGEQPVAPDPEPEKTIEEKPEEPAQPVKPVLTAVKKSGLSTVTKTILKPGAALQQAKLSGSNTKGASDKPTLVVKSPAPAPVKSPWASLPPVSVSPVVVNPPFQPPPQPPAKYSQRDPHGFDSLSQPSAAREIAADTFDRSWRENERNSNRELFNSQSGRYEPAPELRRGSRQQESSRQPAVLQRPSYQSANAPAEPSAAFQTRTTAQMDGSSWGRRRGSSISTGSGPRDRRMSTTKPFEMPPPPPEAFVRSLVGHDAAGPATASHVPSQDIPHQEAAPSQVETQPPPPPVAPSLEDERERQKKLMQEKREAAIKRRQDEEAREEAERKERIRKKMEALGMPPLAPKEEQSATAPGPESQVEVVVPAEKTPALKKVVPATSEAVASVEAPRPEAEVQHQNAASPVKPFSPKNERLGESAPPPFSRRPMPQSVESPVLPGLRQQSPNMPNRVPYQRQTSMPGVPSSTISSPGEHKLQPVRVPAMPGADAFPSWNNGAMTTHPSAGANVWGPPSSNRHIGNGTFDNGFAKLSPGQFPQQHAAFSNPAPFGRGYGSRMSSHAFGPSSGPAQPPGIEQQYSAPPHDYRANEPTGAAQINGTSPLPESVRPAFPPGPIAPPQKANSRPQEQPLRDVSAWTNFAGQAQARETEELARLAAERSSAPAGPQQRWTETFKQTRMDDTWAGGPRKLMRTQKKAFGDDMPAAMLEMPSPAPPASQTSFANQVASPQASMAEQMQSFNVESTVRLPTGPSMPTPGFNSPASATSSSIRLPPLAAYSGNVQPLPPQPTTPLAAPQQSRFFPSALYGGSPPPEEADHPVFGGMTRRPNVKLPAPKPKVKLPHIASSVATNPEAAVIMPQRSASYRVGAQPLVQSSDWQARFNGLFGRAQVPTTIPPSPPKTPPTSQQAPAPAVATSSKAAMDFVIIPEATTVSLPPGRTQSFRVPDSSTGLDIISKPSVDDIFDGELSFGSTPTVYLPRGVAYQEAFAGTRNPASSRPNSKFIKVVESQSKAVLPTLSEDPNEQDTVSILMPYSKTPTKDIPLLRNDKENTSMQSRKGSAKFSKSKRSNRGPDSNSGSPNTASPASMGVSRASSFQTTQSPGPAPDVPNKVATATAHGKPVGNAESAPTSRKNTNSSKTPRSNRPYRKVTPAAS